jgi:hypothetical protein
MLSLLQNTKNIEALFGQEYRTQVELKALINRDPQNFWKALFNLIHVSFGVCRCARLGSLRKISGFPHLSHVANPADRSGC